MRAMQRSFEDSLKIGLENEEAVILLPKLRSYFKTPLTRIDMGYAGLGPRMIGPNAPDGRRLGVGVILPDYELSHPFAEPCGLELKSKGESTPTTITGEDEHGISWNLYLSYLTWQFQHRKQIILMITERSRGEILAATLSKLQMGLWTDLRSGQQYVRPRYSKSKRMGEMAFFGRGQFSIFEQMDPVDLPLFKRGQVAPTQHEVHNIQEVLNASRMLGDQMFWQP